jgi:hypothetical protein
MGRLLIYEFGYAFSGDHLSDEYHEALFHLGAKLERLTTEHPQAFRAVTK